MFANSFLKVAFVTTLVGVAVGTALYETHPPFRNWVDDQFSEFQKRANPVEAKRARSDDDDSDDDDDDDEKTREARSWELHQRTGRYAGLDDDDDDATKENWPEKVRPKDSFASFSSARSAGNDGYSTGAAPSSDAGVARLRNAAAAAFGSGAAFANPFADESAVLFDQDAETLTPNGSSHTGDSSPVPDSHFATPDSSRLFGSARRLSGSSARSGSTASTISRLPRTVASSQAGPEQDEPEQDEPGSVAEALRQNPLMAALNSTSNEDIFDEHVSENETDADGPHAGTHTARWVRRQDELSDWEVQSQVSGFSESVSRDYDFLSSPEEDSAGAAGAAGAAPTSGAATPGPLLSRNGSAGPTSPSSVSTTSSSTSTGFDVVSGASTPRSDLASAESRLRARERLRLLQRRDVSASDTASTGSWDALSSEDGLEGAAR